MVLAYPHKILITKTIPRSPCGGKITHLEGGEASRVGSVDIAHGFGQAAKGQSRAANTATHY
jgi:hypothetical protein